MNPEVLDWDSAYRGEGEMPGPPPWNIGEPQPELAALIREHPRFRTTAIIFVSGINFSDADLIRVMESGRIVEQGDHEQLLAARGAYFDLYNSQFSGAVEEPVAEPVAG